MDKIMDSMILFWGHILDEVGEHVQEVAQRNDVGMLENACISPEMHRELVKETIHAMHKTVLQCGG